MGIEEKNYILIVKKGKFYNSYGVDAYIFNLLLGYKIVGKDKIGFPDSNLIIVKNTLEDHNISYQIINGDIKEDGKDFKKLNKYSKIANSAIDNAGLNQRIDMIITRLKSLNHEDLKQTIERLEECIK